MFLEDRSETMTLQAKIKFPSILLLEKLAVTRDLMDSPKRFLSRNPRSILKANITVMLRFSSVHSLMMTFFDILGTTTVERS